MAKSPDETSRSLAIDSGSGKLQLRNERALVQVKTVLSARSNSIAPELKNALRSWIEEEETVNKQTMGYSLSWKRLLGLIEQDGALKTDLLANCDELRAYVEGVEAGIIVPSPTPPPVSTIVTNKQRVTSGRVTAAIYGRRPTPSQGVQAVKPIIANDGGPASGRKSMENKLKVGNGGPKE